MKILKPLNIYIGDRIRSVREHNKMTQEDLSIMVNVTRTTVVNIEQGRQGVTLDNLYKISISLQVEITQLLPNKEWYEKHKGKKVKRIVTYEIEK